MTRTGSSSETWQRRSRFFLSALYGAAGVLHIAIPQPFVAITPTLVSYPAIVVLLTGVCELLGAVGLLVPRRSLCFHRFGRLCRLRVPGQPKAHP